MPSENSNSNSFPIIFGSHSIDGICAGRKFVTRRVCKMTAEERESYQYFTEYSPGCGWTENQILIYGKDWQRVVDLPYGQVGSTLWTKENYWQDQRDPTLIVYDNDGRVCCRTPGMSEQGEVLNVTDLAKHKFWKKKSCMFQYRWGARCLLRQNSISFQRLHDIQPKSAIDEGIEEVKGLWRWEGDKGIYVPFVGSLDGKRWKNYRYNPNGHAWVVPKWVNESNHYSSDPVVSYASLWSTINKKPGERWQDNPFVFVIGFEVIQWNIRHQELKKNRTRR